MPDAINIVSPPRANTPLTKDGAEGYLLKVRDYLNLRPSKVVEGLDNVKQEAIDANKPGSEAKYKTEWEIKYEHVKSSQMYTEKWYNNANIILDDLTSIRKGISEGQNPLMDDIDDKLAAMQHSTLEGMYEAAMNLSTLSNIGGHWHGGVKWANIAIDNRGRKAGEILGKAMPPSSYPYLRLIHSKFMLEGNSRKLRDMIRNALEDVPFSKGLKYWLARYEMMAGDYDKAYEAVKDVQGHHMINALIRPILEVTSEKNPWLCFPCNFYTYRYTLMHDDMIRDILLMISGLQDVDIPEALKSGTGGYSPEKLKIHTIMKCLYLWNQANKNFERGRYSTAVNTFIEFQSEVLNCLFPTDKGKPTPMEYTAPKDQDSILNELTRLADKMISYDKSPVMWMHFRKRYAAFTLDELYKIDWDDPKAAPADCLYYTSGDSWLKGISCYRKVEEKIYAPLLTMALVFAHFSIAECCRAARRYDDALKACRFLLRFNKKHKVLSDFIEKPFLKILIGQILLDKADYEYKRGTLTNNGLPECRNLERGNLSNNGLPVSPELEAAQTYHGVIRHLSDRGKYITRVKGAIERIEKELSEIEKKEFHPLTRGNPEAAKNLNNLRKLSNTVSIDTVDAINELFENKKALINPHQLLIKYKVPKDKVPGGSGVLKERNPLIYAMVTEALARLHQINAGLNYLGYCDSFIPPWRFQFLLGRARYFAEHAKSLQSEYINFLSNAEREEYQEMLAEQNVVMEKGNIYIESARVNQNVLAVEASKQSKELSELIKEDSAKRVDAFKHFDEQARKHTEKILHGSKVSLLGGIISGGISGGEAGARGGGWAGAALGAITGAFLGGLQGYGQSESLEAQMAMQTCQREYELINLGLAEKEAGKAAKVAVDQLAVANAALVVSQLQRTAAIFRHENAVHNLYFMRGRNLNQEKWYRLVQTMYTLSRNYMRYAVELAFLAEQAYEFEADKPINIIKFDYDVIENGEMVGADFLLNDLDTLEQDMITNQTVNQQQVRYVISLAREFPEAFNDLRINGSTIFALPLEKLERRFPGLFNIRIGNIDITPVALMDPTRFSLELTNMGYNQVRLNRGFQGDSSSSSVQSWNTDIDGIWPVKLSVCGPDTVVLSGMSRQDRDSVFSFITSNQRSPFENLGAASAWRIDMSMEENQVVPDSLADIIITLNLSGYYDAALKKEIESKPAPSRILTQWFSARRNFPDSFYELNHNAIMNWDISKKALSLKQKVGQLRNIGFMLSPDPGRPQFNSLTSTYEFEFTITPGGALEYEIPHINLSQNNLTLDAEASVYKVDVLSAGWEFSWNFGDDTGWLSGSPLQHTYTKPGRYTVVLRTVKGGKLLEYTMWVTVSRKYKLTGPLTVYPSLKITGKEGEFFKITAKPIIPTKLVSTEIALDSIWSANRKILELDSASQFKLETGKYKLSFTAVRDLNARIYSKQCYFPGKTVSIKLLTAASNQYAKDKAGNTQPPNELCRHIFASGPITPDDKWTLELKPEDNEFLRSVTSNDIQKVDLDIVNDIVLSMEYEEN